MSNKLKLKDMLTELRKDDHKVSVSEHLLKHLESSLNEVVTDGSILLNHKQWSKISDCVEIVRRMLYEQN